MISVLALLCVIQLRCDVVTRKLPSSVCITMLRLEWRNCIHRHTDVQPKPQAQIQASKYSQNIAITFNRWQWMGLWGVSFAAMMLRFFEHPVFKHHVLFFLCPDILRLLRKKTWLNKLMISCWVLGKVQVHQSWISLCHGRFLPRTESKREECQCRRGRIRCVFVYQIVRPFPKNTYAIAFGWGVENQLKHIPRSLLSGPMTVFVGGKCIHVTNRPKEKRGSKCGNHTF